MDRPLIGVTTYERNFEGHFSLPSEFVDCVRRAGGIAVLMPPGESKLDQWFETIDGVLISSGIDVDPSLYEGEPHETITAINSERDSSESDLIHQAIDAEMPLLAVCRGVQVLNVALGGDLFQNIPEAFEDPIVHRVTADTPRGFGPTPHAVTLDPGSALTTVMGANQMEIMSWHHQAIDEVGDGLVVVAHASDGVIEAVEMPGHPWLLGVQWHPELSAATDPTQQRLFDGLVRAARGEA